MAEEKEEKSLFGQLWDASAIGINLVVSTFVGLAIGYGLDWLFGTSPYLTFLFLILGIISGFRALVRLAKRQDGTKNGNNNTTRQ